MINAALDLYSQAFKSQEQVFVKIERISLLLSQKHSFMRIHTRADMHVYFPPANATRVQVRSSTLHTRQLMVRIAQVILPHDRLSQLHLLDTHHLRGTRVNLSYLFARAR